MRNYLHKLVALVLFVAGIQSANAYSVTDLESGGWTKVESIENVDNYYYVFVDAKSSSYMMVDAHNRGRAYYRTLSNPLLFENSTWVLESNGNDSYALKNAVTSRYFNSGSAGWNNSLGAANDNANYKFALTNGKYDIQSVQTSQYLGPWNDNGSVAGYGEEIAANKSLDKAPGFLVYAMERTRYNEKLATVFDQVTNDNPMDLTSKIENPCADLNIDGWTKENTIGWNGNNGYDGKKGFFEFCNWGGVWTGKLTQTISSLPNGKYIVKVAAQAAATDVVLTIEANGVSQNLNCIGDKGGNISADGAVVELGQGVGGWQYVSLECVVANGELTISASSSATTAQRWANVDNFTLTFLGGADESDLATEEQKQAYNKALAEAEAHVLGFAAGEYAPYTNVEALKTLEVAKSLNVDEAFAEAVVDATTELRAAVWTVNAEEMNAIYDGSFEHPYSTNGNVQPIGWRGINGHDNATDIRYMWNADQNAGLKATSTGKALFTKFNAFYGTEAGYTMPLKENAVYELTFIYGGWSDCQKDGYVTITGPNDEVIELSADRLPLDAVDGHQNTASWKTYTATFTTGAAGNYVLGLRKDRETEGKQSQYVYGDFKLSYVGAAADIEALDNAKAAFTAKAQEFAPIMESSPLMMIKKAYQELLEEVFSLFETLETITDADMLNAKTEAMTEAINALNKAGEVYAEYNVFVQKFKEAAEISEPMNTEAAEKLEYNMSGTAGMMATSVEALAEAVAQIKVDYLSYISNAWALEEGTTFDVTFMAGITHRAGDSYDAATDAWSASSYSADAPEVTTADGRTAKMIEYNTRVGKEKLNSVVIQQTVWNMPNATYNVELYANAISRNYEVAWAEGADPASFVYVSANDVKTPVVAKVATEITESGVYAMNDVKVTEGSLHLTLSKNDVDGTNWHTVQIKSISLVAPTKPVIEVAEIILNSFQVELTEAGQTFQLVATVSPEEAADKTLTWSSSNEDVATVDQNGLVTAVGNGFTQIKVVAASGAETMCFVIVAIEEEGAVVDIFLNKYVLDLEGVGATFQLVATIDPEDATDKTITWSSSDETVATVDQTGLVTAVGKGEAEIIATASNGVAKTCWVEVLSDEVVGIQNINADADAVIYDIHGRRVEKMTKGLYIVNGKKVMVK